MEIRGCSKRGSGWCVWLVVLDGFNSEGIEQLIHCLNRVKSYQKALPNNGLGVK